MNTLRRSFLVVVGSSNRVKGNEAFLVPVLIPRPIFDEAERMLRKLEGGALAFGVGKRDWGVFDCRYASLSLSELEGKPEALVIIRRVDCR
jgi:hypothetical protein